VEHRTLQITAITALCLLWSGALVAQTTGRIDGWVFDAQGNPLPGVDISVSSPSLLGSSNAISTVDGQFRLLNLPPGDYRLQAGPSGYQPLEISEVLVGLGKTVRLELELTRTFEEQMTVTAALPPAVDHASTTTGANFTENLFTQLPVETVLHNSNHEIDGSCFPRGDQIRTESGIPRLVMRFKMPHLTVASTRWLSNLRADSVGPKRVLNRDTAFSARLCRVQPLLARHS